MHNYQPRFHIILEDPDKSGNAASVNEVSKDRIRTFIFPETQFMAVTAYQNHMVRRDLVLSIFVINLISK